MYDDPQYNSTIFKAGLCDDKMRVHVTTDTHTLTIDCDEVITGVDVNYSTADLRFNEQKPPSIEETARILREKGFGQVLEKELSCSSFDVHAYMGLERLLLRCGHEIPFIKEYTAGHVCDIVSQITPVVKKGIETYYWGDSKLYGFRYNKNKRGWTYFLPPISPE